MKWSLLVGRFWGTEIRLHFSMLLLIPYALLAFRPQDTADFVRVLLLIVAIFICVLLHEIGHTIAARLFGIEVKSIMLWPLGGFANLSRRPEKTLPNLVITAAGPFTNFLLALFFLFLAVAERLLLRSGALPEVSAWLFQANTFPFLVGLIVANLLLTIFNLIPIYPLDGGQIARDVLRLLFGEQRANQALIFISLPLALGVIVLGIVTLDIIVILTGLLLALATVSLNMGLMNKMTLGTMYVLDRGGYYLKNSDYDQAVQEYTRFIERHPNRPGLYFNRAVAYLNLMETERARADMERALSLDKNNYLAWVLRGEIYDLYGENEEALTSYNRSLELKPDFALAFADRGSLYQKMGDLEKAQADLNRAVELEQGLVVVYIMRATLRYQMGDIAAARADNEVAMRYAPDWMLVFPEIFLVNLQGHLDWALDYYKTAIERFPQAYQVYQGRADVLRINGRLDWAVEDYNRALRIAPERSELYIGRGQCYQQLGLLDRAAGDFREAERHAVKSHLRRKAQSLLRAVNVPLVQPSSENLQT